MLLAELTPTLLGLTWMELDSCKPLVVFLPCHCQGLSVLFLLLSLPSLHSHFLNQLSLEWCLGDMSRSLQWKGNVCRAPGHKPRFSFSV